MKKNSFLVFFIVLLIAFSPAFAYEKTISLDKLITKLTYSRSTSLQKFDLAEQYKGKDVKGSGKVKDILKNFGDESKAKVYLDKLLNGKKYEIILTVDKESAKDIKKGRSLLFVGKFEGFTYETLRFADAKIIERSFGPFKF